MCASAAVGASLGRGGGPLRQASHDWRARLTDPTTADLAVKAWWTGLPNGNRRQDPDGRGLVALAGHLEGTHGPLMTTTRFSFCRSARCCWRGNTSTGASAKADLYPRLPRRMTTEGVFADLTEGQRRSLAQECQRLCGRADAHWQGLDDKRATKTSSVPVRYEDARRAVMLRSQGRCENPRCTGDIQDRTDAGDPILEVDHLHDLAKGGEDLPAQIIALCPNCHAIKTRGRTRHDLKKDLVAEARRRHDELSES